MPTQSLTAAALEAWLARYKQAWEQRDPAHAAALFTDDAPYHEMPFDAPKAGRAGIRDYWATVTADQRNVDFKSQVVAVNGQTGVARWSASLTSAASGTRVELDGVFILTVRRQRSLQRAARVVARSHEPLETAPVTNSQHDARHGGIVPPHSSAHSVCARRGTANSGRVCR